jgi:hypothetical protein
MASTTSPSTTSPSTTSHCPTDDSTPNIRHRQNCNQIGQITSNGTSAVKVAAPASADQKIVVLGSSDAAISRVTISASAQ